MKSVLYVLSGKRGRGLHPFFNGEDWVCIRLDPRAEVQPDVLCDWEGLERLESNAYDGLWAPHVLNRLPEEKVHGVLEQFCRILKPGSKAIFVVENMKKLGEWAYKRHWDQEVEADQKWCPRDLVYGDPGEVGFPVRSGFTSMTLASAGFDGIEVKAHGANLFAGGQALEKGKAEKPAISIREEDLNAMMVKRDAIEGDPEMEVKYP